MTLTPQQILNNNATLTLCELGFVIGRSDTTTKAVWCLTDIKTREKLFKQGMPRPLMVIGRQPIWSSDEIRAWLSGERLISGSDAPDIKLVIDNDNLIQSRLDKMTGNPHAG